MVDRAERAIEHQGLKRVRVVDVGVERRRARIEGRGHLAEAHSFDAIALQELQRRGHDEFATERRLDQSAPTTLDLARRERILAPMTKTVFVANSVRQGGRRGVRMKLYLADDLQDSTEGLIPRASTLDTSGRIALVDVPYLGWPTLPPTRAPRGFLTIRLERNPWRGHRRAGPLAGDSQRHSASSARVGTGRNRVESTVTAGRDSHRRRNAWFGSRSALSSTHGRPVACHIRGATFKLQLR